MGLRVVFAGTPEFARVALAALQAQGHEIVLVLSQPDRPAGRGMKLQASPVKQFAVAQGMACITPRSLRLDGKYPEEAQAAQRALQDAQADVMVVAAYGLLLPAWVLALPRHGCLNIHGSLLPRWRGAAPIHRAIEAGDAQTGITIMRMDEGLDTGDMVSTQSLPITTTQTTAELHDALAELGAQMMVQVLGQSPSEWQFQPQPPEGVTYAAKLDKQEAVIDWYQHADQIERKIRAFDPFPGTYTTLRGETIKIWRSEIENDNMPADLCGTVTVPYARDAILVQCGHGTLRLLVLQRAGGKRLSAAEFLRGFPMESGERFND